MSLNMIEIFRDSAFGKLLRIFSGTILLPYPEEAHGLAWRTYKAQRRLNNMKKPRQRTKWDLLNHMDYTVISQASPSEPTETFSK